MKSVFDLRGAVQMITVMIFSGLSAFLMLPLIAPGVISTLTASFIAAAFTLPLTRSFLDEPEGKINFQKYFSLKGFAGMFIDALLVLVVAMGPAVIAMYFMLSLRIIYPVPVASGAALGIYTGYAAFLYRNRGLYESDNLEINF